MPKKGLAKCLACNAEIEGTFPDSHESGYVYDSVFGEIDNKLVNELKQHHIDTGKPEYGHQDFEVFLEGGFKGESGVNTYTVRYIEKGKER